MSFNFSNIGNHSFTQSPNTPLPNRSAFSAQSCPIPPPSGSTSGSNIDPSLLADEAVPPHFIDALTNQFRFGDGKQDLWQNLHGFAKMGQGLDKADIATRAYLLAAIFSLIKENQEMTNACHSTQLLLADLQIQLEVTFSLTSEQKANIHLMTVDLIFDANPITFMAMHFDVEVKLQGSQKELKLSNIYGNPAREKILMGYIKHQCSSIRNSFRELLQDSVIGDSTSTLADFVFDCTSRLKLGGPTVGVTSAHTAHLAILCCFSLENPVLLDCEEELDEEAPLQDEELAHSTSAEPPRKKQKHGGCVPKGEDFWSQVGQWFNACQKQWGDSWTSPSWTSYIAETIAKDEQCFQPQVIHNPFMENVTTDDSYLTGPTSSFVVGLGAIEDLLQAMT
ncbi:hypothetical protein EDC04DRAFT_2606177 [Pisolithus marmoratus]|nr:hypothetical protein EDC04DRAFT_2606177 [Pisolithus marmoratus]